MGLRPLGTLRDIDSHGFAILDELRGYFEQVQSFLMDVQTVEAFEAQWGFEEKPTHRVLNPLSVEEQALYHDVLNHRFQRNLRLEQEKIGFDFIMKALLKQGLSLINSP